MPNVNIIARVEPLSESEEGLERLDWGELDKNLGALRVGEKLVLRMPEIEDVDIQYFQNTIVGKARAKFGKGKVHTKRRLTEEGWVVDIWLRKIRIFNG
jgi:hypothetical protein